MMFTPRDWNRVKTIKLRDHLLAWYRDNRRLLPWRSHATPYRVWIAEIMLQQTRVQTVLPYYQRFLVRFPDIEALASASEKEITQYWAGLGYYQRGRNLLEAARRISTEMGGIFPGTLEEIMRLPGIGRYTAGAIYSIAFNKPQPVVDGNVRRVVSRLHGVTDMPESFFWRQAGLWLARSDPADFNQAIMELGALVCTPSRPKCGQCPLQSLCRSRKLMTFLPSRTRSALPVESVELAIPVVVFKRKVVLDRMPRIRYIPGPWGLPVRVLQNPLRALDTARKMVKEITGEFLDLVPCPSVRHTITRRRILAHVWRVEAGALASVNGSDGRYVWVNREESRRLLTSSLFRKVLEKTGAK